MPETEKKIKNMNLYEKQIWAVAAAIAAIFNSFQKNNNKPNKKLSK